MILIEVLRSNRTRNGLISTFGAKGYIGVKKKRQPILGVSFCTELGNWFELLGNLFDRLEPVFVESKGLKNKGLML